MKTSNTLKRIKPKALATREEFNAAVTSAADHESMIRLLVARRDALIQRVQARYGAKIEPLVKERDAQVALAEKFADENRKELLDGDRKSAEIAVAIFGWRVGNRTVKATSKKFTEALILGALKAFGFARYVRTKEEIAKDLILAEAKTVKIEELDVTCLPTQRMVGGKPVETFVALADLGLMIVQNETFFIEPKVESAEMIKPAQAA